MKTLWGGRYRGVTDELMWAFNASIAYDRRLAQVDIRGSMAYARALERAGVLPHEEVRAITDGLQLVADEFDRGEFRFAPTDEDIHTAVERRLGEMIGPVAGKLHTGRSRNDQIATDIRLFLMDELAALGDALRHAQSSIVAQAERHLHVLMPGYTHLQPAQPVRFSHWLLSYFWMLERDYQRMADLLRRVAVCPLGAGPLAGNAYGIDREALARDLGFNGVTENSMDAVSDRDMLLETLSWAAILGTHLSRLAEDLILWSTAEFGFVLLDERYTTGSSIMPQKRNPDSMELVRGKSGRLTGNLMRLLTVVKGIPSTYDKDLQEDKEPLFDTLDTLEMLLPIVAGVVETLQVNEDKMRAALVEGLLATDLADYLVRRGVPFREAHGLVGQAVLQSEERGVPLSKLPYEVYQAISPAYGPDLYAALDYEASVEARNMRGGTALEAVREQLERAQAILAK
ncbi:MAG: argininosuccinate lyase [Chloroflexi bacterium]|jgi:argininosuccinate lyase|nr:argininosuccinate lyase [Chloroflexota bacterium]